MDDAKRWREEKRAAGLCTGCGKVPPKEGRTYCEECLARSAKKNAVKRIELKEAGICIGCHKGRVAVNDLCIYCDKKKKRRDYMRRWSADKREDGLCPSCGVRSPQEGMARCEECNKRSGANRTKHRNKIIEKGLCHNCGKFPTVTHTLCEGCLARVRKRQHDQKQDRLESGLCVRCGKNPQAGDAKSCYVCTLKTIATHLWKAASRWPDLDNLYKLQGGRCPYSGRELLVGGNASLDHKISKARGGGNDLENLHWIDYHVNIMKWDFTEEEFLRLVHDISEFNRC